MATGTHGFRHHQLGELETARSRHMWTRSAVCTAGDRLLTGQWDGTVTAFDATSLTPQWSTDHPDHAVGIETLGAGSTTTVIVAGRGETGTIAAYDAESGDRRWRYDGVKDVGEAVRDTVFSLPYVVAIETGETTDGEDRLFAAIRRYERDGKQRRWHSTVVAIAADGSVRWRYETDASPIALDLDADGDQLAVGYNRCLGDHDNGLVVLDAATGELEWTWDPGTEGDRRVGDVSVDGDRLAVTSHGDKRGYLLGPRGAEEWRVDLAVETDVGEETLYAYPNHVHAADGRVAFVTGNTYAVDQRETEHRHPNEHRVATFDAGGELLWDETVRGFVHGLDATDERIVVPCAQNFRVRDPATHAVRWFDLETGAGGVEGFDGIATAAAIDDGTIAAIEEPVTYHDDGERRGTYALWAGSIDQ